MQKVEATKTAQQRHQIDAHLAERGQIDANIWKIGVNTALRISDLLSLKIVDVRKLDPKHPAIRLKEHKTGKTRKIIINTAAPTVMRQRLPESEPKNPWQRTIESISFLFMFTVILL